MVAPDATNESPDREPGAARANHTGSGASNDAKGAILRRRVLLLSVRLHGGPVTALPVALRCPSGTFQPEPTAQQRDYRQVSAWITSIRYSTSTNTTAGTTGYSRGPESGAGAARRKRYAPVTGSANSSTGIHINAAHGSP